MCKKYLESNQEGGKSIFIRPHRNISFKQQYFSFFWPLNCLYKKVKLHLCVFKKLLSELIYKIWASDSCFNAKWSISSYMYIMVRTSYIWWDDNDVNFVLDQHVLLDFNTASSLKQQYADRHVTPLRHIIPILS